MMATVIFCACIYMIYLFYIFHYGNNIRKFIYIDKALKNGGADLKL